jgi:hypothetical protein
VIRDAVLHINNEQPLLADLFEAPSPGDVGLRCTNLRSLNGKRPVFVDDIASIFFFPYLHIRFVEIPPGAISGSDPALALATEEADDRAGRDAAEVTDGAAEEADAEGELEISEDFLRRVREV